MKTTKNWRIRYADPNNKESFFFIEGDLGKEGHYLRVEVMQEDFGDHNGYDFETRLADANLIVAAPLLYESLKLCKEQMSGYKTHPIAVKIQHALDVAEGVNLSKSLTFLNLLTMDKYQPKIDRITEILEGETFSDAKYILFSAKEELKNRRKKSIFPKQSSPKRD